MGRGGSSSGFLLCLMAANFSYSEGKALSEGSIEILLSFLSCFSFSRSCSVSLYFLFSFSSCNFFRLGCLFFLSFSTQSGGFFRLAYFGGGELLFQPASFNELSLRENFLKRTCFTRNSLSEHKKPH